MNLATPELVGTDPRATPFAVSAKDPVGVTPTPEIGPTVNFQVAI